ncbi:MAG: ABC transporter permease [Chloroflexota bacterium]|nr:MAG: ABC transporter permease [Chloroflexota bacterium]
MHKDLAANGRVSVLGRLDYHRIGALSGPILLLALMVVFVSARPSEFLSIDNVRGIIRHSTALALIAAGLTVVLTVKEFDLSFPGVVSLSSLLAAGLITQGMPSFWVVVLVLALGMAVGLLNGYLVSSLGLASFVATLGTGAVLTAASLLYSGGPPKKLPTEAALRGLAQGDVAGVPAFIVLLVGALLLMWLLLVRSELGHLMRAVGENAVAARVAGVNLPVVKTSAFVLLGLYAAMAGVFIASDQGAGFVQAGAGFLFDAYAAAFLGAVSFSLGQFNLYGTIVGVIILGILFNGLYLINLDAWQVKVSSGLALVFGLMLARLGGRISGT